MIKLKYKKVLLIANLLSTILIISIHYSTFKYIDISYGLDFNYVFQQALINSFGRGSVPLFSFVSGYFLYITFNKYSSINDFYINKSKTLLLPYIIALTTIFIFSEFIRFISLDNYIAFKFNSFLLNFLSPQPVQFWFLRDLIFFIIIGPLLFKLGNHALLFLLTLLFGFWIFDFQIFPVFYGLYVFNVEFLTFIIAGVCVARAGMLDVIFDKIDNLSGALIFLSLLIVSLLRIYLYPQIDVWYVKDYNLASLLLYKISIAISFVFIFKLSFFLLCFDFLYKLSSFTFFVFLYHHLPLSYIKVISSYFISKEFSFYPNFVFVTFLVFSLSYLLSKIFPAFYSLLTGGRTPEKLRDRLN